MEVTRAVEDINYADDLALRMLSHRCQDKQPTDRQNGNFDRKRKRQYQYQGDQKLANEQEY